MALRENVPLQWSQTAVSSSKQSPHKIFPACSRHPFSGSSLPQFEQIFFSDTSGACKTSTFVVM
jgi:hypothetical protein